MYAPQFDVFFVVQITRSIRNSAYKLEENNKTRIVTVNFFIMKVSV